ncbi:MAG: class I SAM-dependent methyltransferase, partial [Gammaproteobacteria bacterium]|nr:class I SAM-dependent methyltransferase [Gammaproteobacteria bacterium]
WLGSKVAGDSDSYQYLAESIRKHPDQSTLVKMMHEAGYAHCRFHNLSGGIAAIHIGVKP